MNPGAYDQWHGNCLSCLQGHWSQGLVEQEINTGDGAAAYTCLHDQGIPGSFIITWNLAKEESGVDVIKN